MTTHSIGTDTIQGCGCECCGAAGAQDGFIVVASYAEPDEPLNLIWNRAPPEISDAQWRLWNSAKCAEIERLTFDRDSAIEIVKAQEARIAALEACNAALTKALATNLRALNALLSTFTADQPDLPDPPRRPDGTLMPQPKALTVPRETGDKRRIGG